MTYRKRGISIITPPNPDYTNILLPLRPTHIASGLHAPANGGNVDIVTYPELAAPIPDFMTNPDITLNGVACSFSTGNSRYIKVFQDCLPVISNFRVEIWGFSYALPRWARLIDTHGVSLIQDGTNNVQLEKLYEIAGTDKVCIVDIDRANNGGVDPNQNNRGFEENTDHISLGVCIF